MTDGEQREGGTGADRVHRAYRVEGRVQMVGFRAFVHRHGVELGLSGWVRNEPDGSVAIEASGDAESIRRFEEHLRQGPRASRVDRLQVRDLPAPPEASGFDVRF